MFQDSRARTQSDAAIATYLARYPQGSPRDTGGESLWDDPGMENGREAYDDAKQLAEWHQFMHGQAEAIIEKYNAALTESGRLSALAGERLKTASTEEEVAHVASLLERSHEALLEVHDQMDELRNNWAGTVGREVAEQMLPVIPRPELR